ncbi:MAG: FAD-binding oxidoreductase, partial [Flavobacteriales bacterium]
CFIGGNLAENSGGPRAVKYGVTKDWVLDLEVVLPDGEVIHTGAKTLKNSTGYNLTQLMIGSEGTLGIITEATLKLLPLPKQSLLMLAPFSLASEACEAVAGIFQAGVVPSALEFMEKDALILSQKFTGDYSIQIDQNTEAHLLIEVDGNDMDFMMNQCQIILKVLEDYNCEEVKFADDHAQKEALWFLRRRVGEAVKAHSVYKEEDTVVPRFELPNLLSGVKEIGKKYGFQTVCYGHAGDGNLHVNILKGDLSEEQWEVDLKEAITQIFKLCVRLGGTLSGEHGIGYVQKEFMPLAFGKTELELMKGIKNTFDPLGILNPGKIFPS